MRTINNLKPTIIYRLGPGLHHDGRGLYLQMSNKNGGGSWVLRYMFDGKARMMGLGSAGDVPLAVARRKRDELHQRFPVDDVDAIEVERQQRQAAQVEATKAVTFKQCAEAYIKNREAGWRSAKHVGQRRSTLATYAYPVFGDMPVQAVDTALVVKVLEPIWTTTTETAKALGCADASVGAVISRLEQQGAEITRRKERGRAGTVSTLIERFSGRKDPTRLTKAQARPSSSSKAACFQDGAASIARQGARPAPPFRTSNELLTVERGGHPLVRISQRAVRSTCRWSARTAAAPPNKWLGRSTKALELDAVTCENTEAVF